MKFIKSFLLVLFLLFLIGCKEQVHYNKVYVEEDGTAIEYSLRFVKGAWYSNVYYGDSEIINRYTENMAESDYISDLNKVKYTDFPEFLDKKLGFEKYVYTTLHQITREWGGACINVETEDKITSYICYLGSFKGTSVYNFYECINYKVRKENGIKEPERN